MSLSQEQKLFISLLLAWLVACVVASSGIMGVIYLCDPARRESER